MADIPNCPRGREEEYLSDIAGLTDNAPSTPWSRKEAYLAAIDGKIDNMEEQIAALATDISFKGSVATESDLPSGAAVGDAYITEDTGVMYVWTGEDWVALGGTSINVVQTTGTSTTDVMSQNAVSSMIFRDPETRINIKIGEGSAIVPRNVDNIAIGHNALANSDDHSTSIGASSRALSLNSVALGYDAQVAGNTSYGAVAIGAYSGATAFDTPLEKGQVHIGSRNTAYGYNSSNYRLLSGVYDPQSAHDAATKGYVDGLVGNIESALHAINNGGNA